MPSSDVRARIRSALTGTVETPLVLIGNFEVENQWADGEVGLPRFELGPSGRTIVNHMDEFALLLGTSRDHVVLKSTPDTGYLDFLRGLGFDLPTVLCPATTTPSNTVTDDVLDDDALLATLGSLAPTGAALLPHGVSEREERLADRSGLALATPPATICKQVNSKIYSRNAAKKLELRQAPGRTAANLDELAAAVSWADELLDAGRTVVVKDAYGVSGKGVSVVSERSRLAKLRRMIESGARRSGGDRIAVLIEEWVAKRADLNYQFTIGRDASVSVDFVMAAVTEHGVHKGHRMPAPLTGRQHAQLTYAAELIGELLASDGYAGVAGVDAMIDPDDEIYPVVEINARNNMSTYQAVCRELLVDDAQVAMALHYPLKLTERVPFDRLADVLGDCLYDPASGEGFAVNNFATVNALSTTEPATTPQDGRLYGLLVADSPRGLDALNEAITARLRTFSEEGEK